MRLADADLLSLMPRFMRDDLTTQALCKALAPSIGLIIERIARVNVIATLDSQPNDVLDELIWQRNIWWDDKSASPDVRRELIRTAWQVHAHMGTPAAIEQVVRTIFTNGTILEWFEYGGEPYHFKAAAFLTPEDASALPRLRATIERVKNLRSWLDDLDVQILLEGIIELVFASSLQMSIAGYRCGTFVCGEKPEVI